MIRAVLFDFDGVLTADKTGSLTTTRHLSQRTGLDLARVQAAFRRFNDDLTLGRVTHAEVWGDICNDLGRPLRIDLLWDAFACTPLNMRMFELAEELRTSYAVGIVTDNKKDRMDILKARHSLPALFDPIAVSAEFGSGKEDIGIFLSVLQRLDVRPQECIFIDNSNANLLAPDSLGIRTVCFDDALQDIVALRAALRAHGAAIGAA